MGLMTPHREPTITYLKLLATAVFWGGTWSAGRVVAQEVGPYSASFLRFALALLFLLPLTWHQEHGFPRLRRDQVLSVVVLGLVGVFAYNAFFLSGMKHIEASRASMIVANNPILIALLSALLFKEPLGGRRLLGILISVSGALVVISRGSLGGLLAGGFGKGELLILGCVASWVTYSLLGKVLMKDLKPLPAVTYSAVAGTFALAFPAVGEGLLAHAPHYSLKAWLNLAYLGVFGTVFGYVWFYEGIHRIGAARAGLFINFVPVSAVALAWLVLGERLGASLLLGVALVTVGVTLTNTVGSKGSQAQKPKAS